MTPTHIDALVQATREAIAAATEPLAATISELRLSLLALQGDVQSQSTRIDAIPAPVPYDDAALRAQLDSALDDMRREVTGQIAGAGYDDSELRSAVGSLSERVDAIPGPSAPYDDTALVEALSRETDLRIELSNAVDELTASVPPAYDDGPLRDQIAALVASHARDVETLLERIKAVPAYDDTDARATVAQVLETQKDTAQALAALSAVVNSRPVPQNGVDGRDALALEVAPAIDPQKSYPRGSYAKHAGGLWRSFEQTHGMRGWECLVDGVACLEVEFKGKTLELRAIRSSGQETTFSVDVPVQVYKGVFSEDEYDVADTVTWAGSLWHCNTAGTKAKPGDGSPDWTLAVKKGRDGRESVALPKTPGPVVLGPIIAGG